MPSSESLIWTCDRILCSDWGSAGSIATVWASNFVGDSVVFEIAIHPDFGSIVVSAETNYYSKDYLYSMGKDGLPEGIQLEAENILATWAKELKILKDWISPNHWTVNPGFAVPDVQYAALSYAYEHRAKMNPSLVTELLAKDMEVPLSTSKERIRKARAKGFLTSPGKGLAGQGKVTPKATKLLRKEGLLNG